MRDYIPAILILCGIIALETYGWTRALYKQWQHERMRRQKPLKLNEGGLRCTNSDTEAIRF